MNSLKKNSPPRIVICPQCHEPTRWSQNNPFRPFCSERCQLIDFGDWVTENHKIPGDKDYNDLLSEELEPNGH